jgi:hypothetical protein
MHGTISYRLWTRILFWICLIFFLGCYSMATAQSYEGRGRDRDRDAAIQRAVQDAMSRLLDDKIGQPPAGTIPANVKAQLQAKSAVYMPDPDITDEQQQDGFHRVTVSVDPVAVFANVFQDERIMRDILFRVNDPTILVFILDQLKSDEISLETGNAETQIASVLSQNKLFRVINRNLAQYGELQELANGAENLSEIQNRLLELATLENAQIVIMGECSYSGNSMRALGINAPGFNVKANLSASLVETASARNLASKNVQENKSRTTISEAAQMASELAADELTTYFTASLVERWLSQLSSSQTYQFVIRGDIPLRGLLELQQFFQSQQGVEAVRRVPGGSGQVQFDVKYPGDVLYLVAGAGLDQTVQLQHGQLSDVDLQGSTITLNYTAGQVANGVVDARNTVSQTRNPYVGGANSAVEQLPDIGPIDIEQNLPQAKTMNYDAVAVIIGNRLYKQEGKGIPNVEYAHRDAELMKRYLIEVFGYDEGNILMLKDATYSDMASVFGTERVPKGKLANMVKPGKSEVFVFYSGHGAPDADTKTGYLVPVNADPANIKINGYPTDLLYSNLNETGAVNTTVVLDACFSGASGGGEMLIKNASPLAINVKNQAGTLEQGQIFTASSGDQIASWYPDMQHGLFTYQFLKAAKGAADANGDGIITVSEMEQYLDDTTEGVPYLARRLHNRVQIPQVFAEDKSEALIQLDTKE